MYHRFNETKYPSTNIEMEIFKKQINLIKENNLDFYSPEFFHKEFNIAKKEKKILITIDDAFSSFYENAWPYLKENKITDSIKIVDQKPHSEIWEVLQNHSIGIIPFRKNQFSLNCTPTKLFEMMASGLEIVATEFEFWKQGSFRIHSREIFYLKSKLWKTKKNL